MPTGLTAAQYLRSRQQQPATPPGRTLPNQVGATPPPNPFVGAQTFGGVVPRGVRTYPLFGRLPGGEPIGITPYGTSRVPLINPQRTSRTPDRPVSSEPAVSTEPRQPAAAPPVRPLPNQLGAVPPSVLPGQVPVPGRGARELFGHTGMGLMGAGLPTDETSRRGGDGTGRLGGGGTITSGLAGAGTYTPTPPPTTAPPMGGGGFGPFGSKEQWAAQFAAEHGGRMPNAQDELDAQASFDFLAQTGSAPTESDWLRRYYSGYWPGGVEEAGGAIYNQRFGGGFSPGGGVNITAVPGLEAYLPPGWNLGGF